MKKAVSMLHYKEYGMKKILNGPYKKKIRFSFHFKELLIIINNFYVELKK